MTTEERLFACLREFRRLSNLAVKDVKEVAACHREADALLRLEPDMDDPSERYDAPPRVKHRSFIRSLFYPYHRE